MGKKLEKLYDFIEEHSGREGKIELAKLTTIPSVMAPSLPDSVEHVERMRDAIKKITGKEAPVFGLNDELSLK
jgi:hypothetical protein